MKLNPPKDQKPNAFHPHPTPGSKQSTWRGSTLALTCSNVPSQMPNPVKGVEGKWHRQQQLQRSLEPCRKIMCDRDEVGRVDGWVKRVKEVDDRGSVEQTRESDTGDTVVNRQVPGELRCEWDQ